MNMFGAEILSGILEAPRESLFQRLSRPSTFLSDLLIAFSALFSAAIAEVYLSKGTPHQLALGVASYAVSFTAIVWLFMTISHAFSEKETRFVDWFAGASFAVVPLHLLLPAALLAQPFGSSGLLAFELFKLALLAPLYRRALWAIQAMTGWPTWGAALMILLPFAVSLFIFVIGLFFGVALGGLALLGRLMS